MNQPINVLHLLGTAQLEGSGIAKIVAALAHGLNPQKYKLHVWFLKSDGPLVAELSGAGAAARWVSWRSGMRDPVGALRFWRQFRSGEFALVHQHWGARSIRQLIRLGSRAKIIVHSHGQVLEGSQDPVAVRGADAIIAVSQSIAHQLTARQVLVVYSGIPTSEQINWTKSSHGNTIVIGTACRLVEAKGIRDLISAFAALNKELPAVRLEIAGSGPEESILSTAARDQGVAGGVRFLGWCNDLRQVLRNWDVFALPSYDEGLPIAVLEAMAEGLPVVATDVGGIPELVQNEGTGYLIEPKDVDALHKALRKLATSSELRSQFGHAGRLRVQGEFSVEKMVTQIESVYDTLIQDE